MSWNWRTVAGADVSAYGRLIVRLADTDIAACVGKVMRVKVISQSQQYGYEVRAYYGLANDAGGWDYDSHSASFKFTTEGYSTFGTSSAFPSWANGFLVFKGGDSGNFSFDVEIEYQEGSEWVSLSSIVSGTPTYYGVPNDGSSSSTVAGAHEVVIGTPAPSDFWTDLLNVVETDA